ncbi:MAG: hydrogenase [Candidatus Omnitrophica bacterium CG11_big_fil_rev_8_21_14_0_20_45_26]|uniref:Hydrogenase n=1 Tax=Candidatus Abzuiibacterium crystallinum TaxID=1974748 RepID=A0A2H0LL74_9BACT|nr:MAG: hydrogenase [Candidatus Omnitrophica bacterium CG11_big_fil_rev_8_21_14_0_20_45_26]PIW65411.1 MAG: hydrogenase [Candidatus Omnitrophica bacterium CG12_big_fil_rev_8_21_14_0_65_45_16]
MIFLILGLPFAGGGLDLILPTNRLRNWILFLIALAHLGCVVSFWLIPPPAVINGFLALDSFSIIILSVISILFFAVSLYAAGYVQNEKGRSNRIFTACLLFLLFSMTLVTMSQHLGLFWIAMEATTLMCAPLIYFHHRPQALEATWKYLVIGSVGIALALLGTFFLAISALEIKSLLLSDLISQAASLSVPWLKLAIVFLTVGYGTKMGLVPMHSWKPDAYGEAPGPVGALLAGAVTNCAFLAFLRMSQICHAADQAEFLKPILLAIGIASMALASFFMLGQIDFNRLLAYSSIEHMGILILGLGLGGLGIYGSLFHAVNNAFSKGLIFLVSGNLYQQYRTKRIGNIQGVLKSFPFTGGLLVVALLAVTGIPPFGTFFSEFMILNAALATAHYSLAFFYLLFLSIVFVAMSSVVLKMARGLPENREVELNPNQKESWITTVSPLFLAGIALLLGLCVPSFLNQALQKSSAFLGG